MFIWGAGSLFVSFSVMSTLHLKRYHPSGFKTLKLISVFFACLANLFITSMYLLLHLSHSPLPLLCFPKVPYLPVINTNAKMLPVHIHLSLFSEQLVYVKVKSYLFSTNQTFKVVLK